MEDWTEKEWTVFFSIFERLPRIGPGDNDSTKKAFNILKDLPKKPKILDIGCGSGMQTLELAKISNGEVWATDIHQPFLEILKKNALKEGLDSNIKAINMDMTKLDVPKNHFDIIWAEGSIYFYGYENALKNWKPFFNDQIRFVFNEPNYFEDDVPDAVSDFWNSEYHQLTKISKTVDKINELGYKVTAHFKLPKESWNTHYYSPLEKILIDYKNKHSDSSSTKVLNLLQKEIDFYKKYSKYYGYTFYICEL